MSEKSALAHPDLDVLSIMFRFFLLLLYSSSATCSERLSRHRRSWIIDTFTMEEGHSRPFPYDLGKVEIDLDYLEYFELYGEGVDKEPKGVLSIDKESGTIQVTGAVDFEEKTVLKLHLEAKKTDSLNPIKLGIEIYISDINDNPPRFQRDLFEISVGEETPQGSHLLTVVAYDRDQSGTPNSTFHYEIKSVSPNHPDTQFVIDRSGAISFKGCLHHEVVEMFTVVVEAKDHGDVVSLSSSTTVVIHVQDGNKHLPTISGQTPFDFEEEAQTELTISVENEAPYFFCKVKERTPSGLWKVDTSKGEDDDPQPHSVKVIIEVEDINDPPLFRVLVKEAMLEENAPIGIWVEKVTAVDPDPSHVRGFVYQVGSDPAGWLTVDPHTGDITTAQTPDRESPHVVNGVYTVLLHAVDHGEPPLTGTATLSIHVTDQNDNVPQPTADYVDVCVSDGPTTTNITAFDLDETPFGGPFMFELLGDVSGKWKLNPSHGYVAGLVKEPGVYAGPHTIDLKISDMQGKFGSYNLSVTVCDCSETPNCRSRRGTDTHASGAIGIVFASLFLLLCLLLMAVQMTCNKEFTAFQSGDSSGETLLISNIEIAGTDCKVPNMVLAVPTGKTHPDPSFGYLHDGSCKASKEMEQNIYKPFRDYRRQNISYLFNETWDQTWNSFVANSYHHTHQIKDKNTMNYLGLGEGLLDLLHQRLSSLQEMEGDLLDDQLHLYADEGDDDDLSELENIFIPEENSFHKVLEDLGPKFMQLAYICKSPHIQN